MATPSIISANISNIKVDSEAIPGLQSLEFRIVRNRQNVHNIGSDERIGVDYGPMFVAGSMRVRSTYPKFDTMLVTGVSEVKSFQLTVDLKRSFSVKAEVKGLSFDDCYLEGKTFSMDANGVGISEYSFTATRMRET